MLRLLMLSLAGWMVWRIAQENGSQPSRAPAARKPAANAGPRRAKGR